LRWFCHNEEEEEDNEYYTPMSNFRKEEMSHEAEEIKTSGTRFQSNL
jgi:hypothetical protein